LRLSSRKRSWHSGGGRHRRLPREKRAVCRTSVLDEFPGWFTLRAAIGNRAGRVPALSLDTTSTRIRNMKIRPLQDRIVVKRLEGESKTKGGIIIPDTAKEKPIEGKVVAVGNGKVTKDGKVRPVDVKVGDVVLFGKYSGTEVKIDGEEHVLIREDDVLAVTG
jgi:chaperonin GroES